jgi:hypothetical protein
MKTIPLLSLVLVLLCSSCGHTPQPSPPQSVFPEYTVYPSQKNMPRRVIDDLPRRIRALPGGNSLSISRLVGLLGLSAYRSNVSANFRWNTFFMHLDSDHILYFSMDPSTIPDGLSFQTPWSAKVVECSMGRNPDVTLFTKELRQRSRSFLLPDSNEDG